MKTQTSGEYPFNLLRILTERNNPSEDIVYEGVTDRIDEVLNLFTNTQSSVIKMRFIDQKKFREIGEILHLSSERARQIQMKTICKLAHPFRAEYIFYGRNPKRILAPLDDICRLNLSPKIYNCLKYRAGIETIYELQNLSDEILLRIDGIGHLSVREIRDKLEQARWGEIGE